MAVLAGDGVGESEVFFAAFYGASFFLGCPERGSGEETKDDSGLQ